MQAMRRNYMGLWNPHAKLEEIYPGLHEAEVARGVFTPQFVNWRQEILSRQVLSSQSPPISVVGARGKKNNRNDRLREIMEREKNNGIRKCGCRSWLGEMGKRYRDTSMWGNPAYLVERRDMSVLSIG